MTHDEFIHTCHTMRVYGGGFATSIAEAGLSADSGNKLRLLQAFPEVFAKYAPGTAFYSTTIGQGDAAGIDPH